MIRFAVPVLLLVAWSTQVAQALEIAPELRHARMALTRYDLEGGETLETLHELHRFVEGCDVPGDRREGRFLRAMVGADLVMLSARTGNPALRERLAEALEVPSNALIRHLERELEALSVGVYREGAQSSKQALRLALTDGQAQAQLLRSAKGVRSDAFYVGVVRDLVAAEEGTDVQSDLARFAEDPCAESETCPAPWTFFDAQGRRAGAALERALQAASRIEQAAGEGDPFSKVMLPYIQQDVAALEGQGLHPTPVLESAWGVPEATPLAKRASPDLVIVVSGDMLRYAFTPSLRVQDGALARVSRGAPVLPEMAEVRLPASFRPWIRRIDEVVDALQPVVNDETSVAIAAAPGFPAHVFSRILLSLRRLGKEEMALLARHGDGSARVVPLQIVVDDEERSTSRLAVRVRLGGYSVRSPSGSKQIDRARQDDEWRFQPAKLDAHAEAVKRSEAELSYMSNVASQEVMAAALQLAPSQQPLKVVVR